MDLDEVCLKVTVLGASGFLGSSIAASLERSGIDWVGVAIEPSSNKKIHVISPNEPDKLVSVINQYPIVINATGTLKPKTFESNPEQAMTNFWGNVEYLSSVFSRSSIKKLVHLSSGGTVYGEGDITKPHRENTSLKPISWYGRAKLFEELYYERLMSSKQSHYLCARVSNPYGNPNRTIHGVIDVLVNSVITGEEVNIYKDSDTVRDYIYAPDMADIIVNLIKSHQTGIYNVASGEAYSLSELISIMQSICSNVNINKIGDKPKYDVFYNTLDISKIIEVGAYKKSMEIPFYMKKKLHSMRELLSE